MCDACRKDDFPGIRYKQYCIFSVLLILLGVKSVMILTCVRHAKIHNLLSKSIYPATQCTLYPRACQYVNSSLYGCLACVASSRTVFFAIQFTIFKTTSRLELKRVASSAKRTQPSWIFRKMDGDD